MQHRVCRPRLKDDTIFGTRANKIQRFQHCKASPKLPVLPTNPAGSLPSAEAAGTGVDRCKRSTVVSYTTVVSSISMAGALIANPATPSLHRAMQSTMERLGLSLHEKLMFSSSFETKANVQPQSEDRATAIYSGLARLCDSEAFLRAVMLPCSQGTVAMAFVLQRENSGAEGTRHFTECLQHVRKVSASTSCRTIFVRHRFQLRRAAWPLTDASALRVQIQTLTLGRAFDWASSLLPATFYIRTRLDSPWCLMPSPPWAWPLRRKMTMKRPVMLINAVRVIRQSSRTRSSALVLLHTVDRWAVVHADAASIYFEAWRVWESLNFSNPCHMGVERAGRVWRYSGDSHTDCTGEDVLSVWLTRHQRRFVLPAMVPLADVGLVRRLNRTHAAVEAEKDKWSVTSAPLSEVVAAGRRKLGSSPCAVSPTRPIFPYRYVVT